MEPRNWIGIIIILVGVILQPIGWMFVFWIQWLSFALIFIGVFIFATQRYIEKLEEREFNGGSSGGQLGDVHDYSGWGEGGRSESWSSSVGSDSGGGGNS